MKTTLFDLEDLIPPNPSWFLEILHSLEIEYKPAWPDLFGKAIHTWIKEHKPFPIKTLSIFSGGGGLDIAFHEAGFDLIEMVEIEPKYVATLEANTNSSSLLEHSRVLCLDIRNYHPDPKLKVDFIIGGPPCQTFSAAARRASGVAGTTDPRGVLFEDYVRLLKTLLPKGFLFENVYGITGAQNGQAWKDIQTAFKEAGYNIYYRLLDTADYGVPQHRERLFIIGIREGLEKFLFPYPTHGPDSIGQHPYYTAKEAVDGADNSGIDIGINGRFGQLLYEIPPGLNYSFFTKEMGHPKPIFSWRSKFSDFLYKADPNTPVRTIKAQGGQYTGPFSWENRKFSIPEFKRLQTFPDEYKIVGKRQISIEQIGNSVPPQMGRMLALSILNQLFEVELPFPMHYLPEHKELNFRKRKRLLTEIYAEKARIALQEKDADLGEASIAGDSNIKQTYCRSLSNEFDWSEKESTGIKIYLSTEFSDTFWKISAGVSPIFEAPVVYTINILPVSEWVLGSRTIELQSRDLNYLTFTALWKAFEEKVTTLFGIADLVQLSGYYHYIPKFRAELKLSGEMKNESQWRILHSLVQRRGKCLELSTLQLSSLWKIEPNQVLPHLQFLRNLGYEVRNCNTNPQIPIDKYLIPYIFPTFTSKSVQFRKRLEA